MSIYRYGFMDCITEDIVCSRYVANIIRYDWNFSPYNYLPTNPFTGNLFFGTIFKHKIYIDMKMHDSDYMIYNTKKEVIGQYYESN